MELAKTTDNSKHAPRFEAEAGIAAGDQGGLAGEIHAGGDVFGGAVLPKREGFGAGRPGTAGL